MTTGLVALSRAHDLVNVGAKNPRTKQNEYEFSGSITAMIWGGLTRHGVPSLAFDYPDREEDIKAFHRNDHALRVEVHLNADKDPAVNYRLVLYSGELREDAKAIAEHVDRAMGRVLDWRRASPRRWDAPGFGRAASFFGAMPAPALIIEPGFVTHAGACEWLFNDGNQKALANSIVVGIIAGLEATGAASSLQG